ncbi:MAG: hypothetical protein LBH51_01115 [Treponema sp.]|nr:hypothetical protein [Treponema sp.]
MAKSSPGPRLSKSGGIAGNGYGLFALAAVLALLIFAILAAARLEVYERERWVLPSGEFLSNNFYVLGEWLSGSGRPVRFSPRWAGKRGISPREGGLFIQASLFDWEREDILPWVREGGILMVSIDFPWYRREDPAAEAPPAVLALEEFLEKLEISIRPPVPERRVAGENAAGGSIAEGRTAVDGVAGADEAAGGGGGAFPGPESDAESEYAMEPDEGRAAAEAGGFPDYDLSIVFEEPAPAIPALESEKTLVLRDARGNIRLIRRALGKGWVAVAGFYVFMYNYHLEDEANARLAWELTGASLGPERPAILFVRSRRGAEGLFGILRERGNLLPPVLSILVLIFTGFWMTLPGFGVPLGEDPRKQPSIIKRFSAEARFLRRHDALRVYLGIYLRELRRRGRGRPLGRECEEVEAALAAGKKISPRKMAVYLENLMSALERL